MLRAGGVEERQKLDNNNYVFTDSGTSINQTDLQFLTLENNIKAVTRFDNL